MKKIYLLLICLVFLGGNLGCHPSAVRVDVERGYHRPPRHYRHYRIHHHNHYRHYPRRHHQHYGALMPTEKTKDAIFGVELPISSSLKAT